MRPNLRSIDLTESREISLPRRSRRSGLVRSTAVARLLVAAVVVSVFGFAGAPLAQADAVVSTSIVAGDPTLPGGQFTVRVAVTSNDTGTTPGIFALFVTYPTNSISYVSATSGDLGAIAVGPAVHAYPDLDPRFYREVTTAGNASATGLTPACFDMVFDVLDPGVTPYSILVSDSSTTAVPTLGAVDLVTPIPHSFDNTVTTDIAVAYPTPTPSPTPVVGSAVVRTRIVSGDPSIPGADFSVDVEIESNTTALFPAQASFRIAYPLSAVSFVGVTAGDLGDPVSGPEEFTALDAVRDISTESNLANANPTPLCFTLTFHTLATPNAPFSILVSDDPDSSIPLIATNLTQGIPHTFDNSLTTGLGIAPTPTPVTGSAVVRTRIVSGDPSIPGADFSVAVEVESNTTGLIPAQPAFRIAYPLSAVTFVGAAAGDLGDVAIGPQEAVALEATRDITTESNIANANPTPLCFTLTFHTLATPSAPFSILVSNDPASPLPLVATNLTQNIPHTFDNAFTTGIGIAPTPTPVTGSAVVRTRIAAGDPSIPDADFSVAVEVESNTTGLVPAQPAFRIAYPLSAVTFVGAAAGDLGNVVIGPEEVVALDAVRDITTESNVANANATPLCFTLTFHTLVAPVSPFSILVSDDPDSSMPLVATNLFQNIPHTFDNSQTDLVCSVPSLTCPAPVTVECIGDVPLPDTGLVTIVDVCGTPTLTWEGDVSDANTCPETITRTYRLTDFYGNFAECTQTITVDDTTPPSIACPAPVTVECVGDVPAPDTGLVVASDNCSTVTVTWIGDVSDANTCPEIITRTYRAIDACGNINDCTQTITVDDTTPPSIACPAPISVQCIGDVPAPDTGLVTASDNCSTVTVTWIGDVSDANACPETITRTYRAIDACGNVNDCTQAITVDDTTPPSIACPAPISVQCIGDVPAPDTGLVTASDNCSTVTVTWIGDVSDANACPETITRTYRAIDACGNINDCTQTITVDDTTPPSIACPAPISVQCIGDVPAPETGLVTASDNCSTVTVTWIGDVSNLASCPEIITRTYRATDACGNINDCTQSITVDDTTPPSIACPAPISVQCIGDVPAPDTGLVTASDNCSPVTVTWIGDVSNLASCPEIITRTYRATDACGNFNDCTQAITVDDTTPPSIACPAPISVQCIGDVPAPDTGLVVASDNCSTVTVTWIGDVSDSASCPETITRTYRAVDACGNVNDCTQAITVDDTTPPSIACPAPISVQCSADVPAPDTASVTASDNCSTAVVTWMGDVSDLASCPETITRTYRATDACGNFADCTQTITVDDTIQPVVACPGPQGVEPFVATVFSVSASDNCDPSPIINLTFEDTAAPDEYSVTVLGNGLFSITLTGDTLTTVTATAIDACGNASDVCVFTIGLASITTYDDVYVDDDWTTGIFNQDLGGGRTFGVNAFETIQRGVNGVTSGGNIHIYNGLYTQSVNVYKSARFLGESQAGVVLQARAGSPLDGVNAMTVSAGAASTITLSQMTLRNGDYGIVAPAVAEISILDCVFQRNGYDGTPYPFPTTQLNTVAAYAALSTDGGAISIAGAARADVIGCTIDRNDRAVVFQNCDNLTIRNNTIHDNLQRGIFLDRGAGNGPTGTLVEGNVVYANKGDGIAVQGGRGVVLRANNVYNNWNTGIRLESPSDTLVEGASTVTNNSMRAYDGRGLAAVSNGGVSAEGAPLIASLSYTLRLVGATITNNNAGSLGVATGVHLGAALGGAGILVSSSTISGHQRGVWVLSQGATTQIANNNIMGNANGLRNDSANLDARNNWWGSYLGPSGTDAGGRVGDSTIGLIITNPWTYGQYGVNFDGDALNDNADTDDDEDTIGDLMEVYVTLSDPLDPTDPNLPTPGFIYVDDNWIGTPVGTALGASRFYGYNAFATIQEGIDAAISGDQVLIADGVYPESPTVATALSLVGPSNPAERATVIPAVKPANAIIDVAAGVSPVHIQYLAIDGSVLSPLYTDVEVYRAIYFPSGSGGSVTNCRFSLTTPATFGLELGTAIDVLDANVDIENNLFADFHKYAVFVRNSGVVNVRDNTFLGGDPTVLGNTFVQNALWFTDDNSGDVIDPSGEISGNGFQSFGPSGPPNPTYNGAKVVEVLGLPATGICIFIDLNIRGTSPFLIHDNSFDSVQTAFVDNRIYGGGGHLTTGDILASNTMVGLRYYAEGPLDEGAALHGQICDDPNYPSALMAAFGYGLYSADELHVGPGIFGLQQPLLAPDDPGTPGLDPITFVGDLGASILFLPADPPASVVAGPSAFFSTYPTVSDIAIARDNYLSTPTIRIAGPVQVTVGTNGLDADSGRNQLYIQDFSGADGQSAIRIDDPLLLFCRPFATGDRLNNVLGIVSSSNGMLQIQPIAPPDFIDNQPTTPALLLTGTENFEDIESELVRVENAGVAESGLWQANTNYQLTAGVVFDDIRIEDASGAVGYVIPSAPFTIDGIAVEDNSLARPLQIQPRIIYDVNPPPPGVTDWMHY